MPFVNIHRKCVKDKVFHLDAGILLKKLQLARFFSYFQMKTFLVVLNGCFYGHLHIQHMVQWRREEISQ